MDDLEYIEEILRLSTPGERVSRFAGDGRLRTLLPELYRLDGVPQPPEHHPEGDALVHTLLAVRHLPADADRRLGWAALLHDIGKSVTTRQIEGRIRAYGHDREGARMADAILSRLGMPEPERSDIVWLVRHHMFALSWRVVDVRALSRRQRRFMADPRFPLLLDLLELDALAAGGHAEKLSQVAFYRRARARTEIEEDHFITG